MKTDCSSSSSSSSSSENGSSSDFTKHLCMYSAQRIPQAAVAAERATAPRLYCYHYTFTGSGATQQQQQQQQLEPLRGPPRFKWCSLISVISSASLAFQVPLSSELFLSEVSSVSSDVGLQLRV
jgi:hypothetical protein